MSTRSHAKQENVQSLNQRKLEILTAAIDIVVNQGYANLTMRNLARAVGMKLGALQYHFATKEEMMRSLAAYIEDEYRDRFEMTMGTGDAPTIQDIAIFFLDDLGGKHLSNHRLWPQLWAMAQVEPVMKELVDSVYERYLDKLETALIRAGNPSPRIEALTLMATIEASTLFVGPEAPWHEHADALRDHVINSLNDQYPTT